MYTVKCFNFESMTNITFFPQKCFCFVIDIMLDTEHRNVLSMHIAGPYFRQLVGVTPEANVTKAFEAYIQSNFM